MIANLTATGWEIIYHRAHALLAAQLGGQWKRSKSPLRLYETIAAISHHDDLEKEWEEDILTEAGAPLDFTLDTETSLPKMRGLMQNALYRAANIPLAIHRGKTLGTELATDHRSRELVGPDRNNQGGGAVGPHFAVKACQRSLCVFRQRMCGHGFLQKRQQLDAGQRELVTLDGLH